MEGIAIALRAAERVVPAHTLKADGAVVRAINLLELDLIDGQFTALKRDRIKRGAGLDRVGEREETGDGEGILAFVLADGGEWVVREIDRLERSISFLSD